MPSITDLNQSEQNDLMSLDIKPMSPLKLKYINILRERSKDLLNAYPYPDYITSDVELLRFTRGHMYDMDETYEAFSKMLIWRKENNVNEYFKKVQEVDYDVHRVPFANVFEPIFQTNYSHKTDKDGHLVDIRNLGSIDVKKLLACSMKDWIDYTIYILEWRIYTLNKMTEETGVLQRLVCIQDLKGIGMHMVSPTLISYLREMTHVTSHNYPETMQRSFVVNVPGIFSSLWAMAKPIMHPRTVKKVTICKGDYQQKLYEEIPVGNLPASLGGICNCEGNCISCLKNEDDFSIPVTKEVTVPLAVKKGDIVTWKWKLESGNINVIVSFVDEAKTVKQVYKGDRVENHESKFEVLQDGLMKFYFDNNFSWLNSKTVIGMIKLN